MDILESFNGQQMRLSLLVNFVRNNMMTAGMFTSAFLDFFLC